jgi:hypothetical protein
LVSLAVLAPICFAGVLLLAGPHGSVLPSAFDSPLLLVGWGIILIVPLLVARAVWRRPANRRK